MQIIQAFQHRLALAGRAHDRFDQAGKADALDCGAALLEGVGKLIGRGRQAQLFGGQAANAFTVHGQLRSAGTGDNGKTFILQLDQGRGGNGLDFRNDIVRLLQLDHRAQGCAIEHIDHVAAMRHLHGRRVRVTVNGNHLDTKALQFDHHFLAQLARATQQHTGRARRQRGSDTGHGESSN